MVTLFVRNSLIVSFVLAMIFYLSLFLGADTKTGYLFCSECDDFIYDPKLDSMHLEASVSADAKQAKFQRA